MPLKSLLKEIMPPILLRLLVPRSRYGWFGPYSSWADAQKFCTGYDAAVILEKCREALLKVKNGEAAYERDSVIFDKIEYSWPVLAGLLRCAAEHEGRLHVLDFGGSLGSSYFQNRSFLEALKKFSWSVVEQRHFVDCGKEYFAGRDLKFFYSVDECCQQCQPNVVLLSSVLQYLEAPGAMLNDVIGRGVPYVIIDRTPFFSQDADAILVQKVPKHIYEASYPSWVFSLSRFKEYFAGKYEMIAEFEANDGVVETNDLKIEFRGFIFRKTGRRSC